MMGLLAALRRLRAKISRQAGSQDFAAKIYRWGLFRKYATLFVVTICVAMVANGVLGIWFFYQEQRRLLLQIQRQEVESATTKIGQFIKDIESQLQWTVQLPWSADALDELRFDGLRLFRQVPAITELIQLDSSGREQLRLSSTAIDVVHSEKDFSNEPMFIEALARKVYYGPVYFRDESEPFMVLAIAGNRRSAGVLVAQINLKLIWDVVSQLHVGERGQAYVIDAQGRLIAHRDISLVLRNTDFSNLTQVKLARGSSNTSMLQAVDGEDILGRPVLAAHAPVSPLGWLVFVEVPVAAAYASLYAEITRSVLLLVAAIGLTLLAGTWLARRMVAPIQVLHAGATRIGRGDLGQRISVKTGDELEALADQFNDMASRLEESYSDLQRKVEIRTHELSEALEQQTAISETLRAIRDAPGDLQPVFEAMLATAMRICDCGFGMFLRYDGALFHADAMLGLPPRVVDFCRAGPGQTGPDIGLDRLVSTRQPIQIPDVLADNCFTDYDPEILRDIKLGGIRTFLAVPMLKESELIGAILLFRQEVRLFTDKQIEFVANFASQAVIAIENIRLLSELRARTAELTRSVAQLQALGDVSQTVNSTVDLETVLSTIVAKAVQLSDTEAGAIYVHDDTTQRLSLRATYGMSDAVIAAISDLGIDEAAAVTQASAERIAVQVPDLRDVPSSPLQNVILAAGFRALLVVPLLRPDHFIGVLVIRRKEAGLFPEHVVDLLQTFATQSVLAVQNARLFGEIEEKNRQLSVANLAKSRFIAAANHDLRQPLHALGLMAEQLRTRINAAERARTVERMNRAVTALDDLFDSLLDISKLDLGVLTPNMSTFPIAHLLERIESAFTGVAREKGLTLRVVSNGAWLRSDAILLERILMNLVSNALRYTVRGGVTVGCRRRGDLLRVEVWDSGPGIPDDQRQAIFGEFYRLTRSDQERHGGLGLGLAIVDRLCQLLDHRIELTSTVGKGSCFAVLVPVATALKSAGAQALPKARFEAFNGKLVVIIDDDAMVLDSTGALLRSWGCHVVSARSESEVLPGLAEHARPPDLVISDYHLSDGKTGIEAIARLREAFNAAIPAFLISGDTDPQRLREARAAHYHLLHKPVRPMALRNMLRRFLKTHDVANLSVGESFREASSSAPMRSSDEVGKAETSGDLR